MVGVKRAIRGLMAVVAVLGCAVPAAQASLGVPTGGSATTYTSMTAFEQAATGGFRHANWDSLAVDGSDLGSTAIPGGHTAAIARDRLEPWGIELGSEIAVANDGFNSTNPNVNFAPFSSPNVWAPFNSNTAELQVVVPAAQGTTPVPAQTRGIGVELLGVTSPGTSIEYYNGDIPLLNQPVPSGATFSGAMFRDPVVTRAVVTLGTGEIFDYNGSTASPGPATSDLVAGDDIALGEPAPARGAVAATAGVPVTAALDAFTESNPSAKPTALIDWGDGTSTGATIAAGPSGTFLVAGNHAYAQPGSYIAQVTVDDSSGPEQTKQIAVTVAPRATATAVTCSPAAVAVSAITTCTATVSDAAGGAATAPGGIVWFASPTPDAAFPQSGACLLGPTAAAGVASCAVQFTAGQLPPRQARVSASYAGAGVHAASAGTARVAVHPQRCTLKALTGRLRAQGLGVLVTCDARAGVRIVARAVVARKGRVRGFQLQFGTVAASVGAGRPTVLVIKPIRGVVPVLRAAVHRHQRVALKLTLTASSHATTRRTTTRVSALRLR